MKNYKIQDTEAGNFIEEFDTLQKAKNMLANYESQDKKEGVYVPDFYEIVQQKMIVKSNAKKMTFTILKDGNKYMISAFTKADFENMQFNTINDWNNYLKTQSYK